MKRLVLLTVIGALALGASEVEAHTTVIVPPDAHAPYQQWIDQALVPTPPVTITLAEASTCGGAAACAPASEVRVDAAGILADWKGQHPWGQLRFVFLHEIGHQFDFTVFTGPYRDVFRAILESDLTWEGGLAESFADAYALCALRSAVGRQHWSLERGRLYKRPGQHRRVCELIDEAGQS